MSSPKHEVEQSIFNEQMCRPFQGIAAVVIKIFCMLVVEWLNEKETSDQLGHKNDENQDSHYIDKFFLKSISM